jgi:hypothetical protein
MNRLKFFGLVVAFLCIATNDTIQANRFTDNTNHAGDIFCAGVFLTSYCGLRAFTNSSRSLSMALGALPALAPVPKIKNPNVLLVPAAMVLAALSDPDPEPEPVPGNIPTITINSVQPNSTVTYPRYTNISIPGNVGPNCRIRPEEPESQGYLLPLAGIALLAPCLYFFCTNQG